MTGKSFREELESFAMHIMEEAQMKDVKLPQKVEAFTAITRYYTPNEGGSPNGKERPKVGNFSEFQDRLKTAEEADGEPPIPSGNGRAGKQVPEG